MSCNDGILAPGNGGSPFVVDVTSPTIDMRVLCGTSDPGATIHSLGGDLYNVSVPSSGIKCPGPLKIEYKLDGVWHQLKCYRIQPCP